MNVTIIYHCGLMDAIKPFYRELNRLGCQVSIIVPKKILIDPIYRQDPWLEISAGDREPSFRVYPVELIDARRYNLGFNPVELCRALKSSEPDIIHVFNEFHCFPVSEVVFIRNHFLKRNIPVMIYGFQNIDYLNVECRTIMDFLKRIIRRRIVQYNVKNLFGMTAASSQALEIVKHYNPSLRTQKIFWGIDLKTFFPKDKKICRQRLGLPADKSIVGYFGRMIQEKGIETLLRAVALLNKKKDVLLILIGKGNSQGRIRTLAVELGIEQNIILKSTVDSSELNAYYNSLDCFVLASETGMFWKEQYGRVLIEAMACGVPVVASKSGAIPDILEGCAAHILVEEGSVDDLARAIDHQISSQNQSKNFDARRFSLENFAQRHMEFYLSLVSSTL